MATTRKDRARIDRRSGTSGGGKEAGSVGASERERRGCQGFRGWRTVKEEAPMKESRGERER